MTDADVPVVMIVEDEPAVAEGYELWLREDYETRVAGDGAAALEKIDDEVDVVLLDRRMPELSGEDVLADLRERDVDVRVAMVTAVEPDFDVVGMGFDAYVTKPPEREELLETIDRLLERADLDDDLQEYYSLMARKATLEAEKTEAELAGSDAYTGLENRIEAAKAAADDALGDVGSDEGFVGAARELFGEPGEEPEQAADAVEDPVGGEEDDA
jgi:DNA-binding response OmpR family regulator